MSTVFHSAVDLDESSLLVDALSLSRIVRVRRVSYHGVELDEMFLDPGESRAFALALIVAADEVAV